MKPKKKKSFVKDTTPDDINRDVIHSQLDKLDWLTDEIYLQLTPILQDYNNNVKRQTRDYAIRLIPYFQKAIKDEILKIRKMGEEGLKFINNEFPDLLHAK